MKTNIIAFAICASAFLASPALAQPAVGAMSSNEGTVKTPAENDKLTITENVLKPGQSAAMGSRMGAAIYYVQGGTIELDYKDGTKKTVTRASGPHASVPKVSPILRRISVRPLSASSLSSRSSCTKARRAL
jgi:hypothetical protein